MANPSIEKIVVHSKITNGGAFDWDVSFVCVTSQGTRNVERKSYINRTGAQVLAAVKALAVAYETAEATPVVVPPPDFPLRYDATKAGLTALDPADYPPGETPAALP